MKHWMTSVICGIVSALVLASVTPARGQASDAAVEDAGTQADAGSDDAGAQADAGSDDAGVLDAGPGDAGTSDAGSADAGKPDPEPAPVYDLIDRNDGGRACSTLGAHTGGPGIPLALLLVISLVFSSRSRGAHKRSLLSSRFLPQGARGCPSARGGPGL